MLGLRKDTNSGIKLSFEQNNIRSSMYLFILPIFCGRRLFFIVFRTQKLIYLEYLVSSGVISLEVRFFWLICMLELFDLF